MAADKTKSTVTITPNYRLATDGERQYSLEQRVTIDPAKSPAFFKRLQTEPDAVADPPYEDWRDIGRYYPMSDRGLAAAAEYVAHREAAGKVEALGVVGLAEFVRLVREVAR